MAAPLLKAAFATSRLLRPGSRDPRPPPRRDAPPADWRTNTSMRCCESTAGVTYTTALYPVVLSKGARRNNTPVGTWGRTLELEPELARPCL